MKKIIDLHVHSRYSRACSKNLELPNIARACEKKGIDIVGTGDFTHPAWVRHIEEQLVEDTSGIFKLKGDSSKTRFLLTTELSCIYKQADAVRRIHVCVFAPGIKEVEGLIQRLEDRGCNLKADGRPILGISGKELLKILLDISPKYMMVPAHAWTPWFAVFGSKSGFDSLEECFGELTPHIFAIETGLSSDPAMNWRLSALDTITLLSNSDAHSLDKLGREANVLDLTEGTYQEISEIIKTKNRKKFLYTIEFFPEEGKYHYDGHRDCHFVCDPARTKREKGICPQCKKKLTVGVVYRVDNLADRAEGYIPKNVVPFKRIVPLKEIIASVLSKGSATKIVTKEYDTLIQHVGNEFYILMDAPIEQVQKATRPEIAEGIKRVRDGRIMISPGYDGVFGSVEIFKEAERTRVLQKNLFDSI